MTGRLLRMESDRHGLISSDGATAEQSSANQSHEAVTLCGESLVIFIVLS